MARDRLEIEKLLPTFAELAKDVRRTGVCLDLLTYIFVTRAFEFQFVRALKSKRPEDIWTVMDQRRRMDEAAVNAVRNLYPVLLSLDDEVAETILRAIHRLEHIQGEIDDFILEAAKSGKAEVAYRRLFEGLLKASLDLESI